VGWGQTGWRACTSIRAAACKSPLHRLRAGRRPPCRPPQTAPRARPPEVREDEGLHHLRQQHHHGPQAAAQRRQEVLVAVQQLGGGGGGVEEGAATAMPARATLVNQSVPGPLAAARPAVHQARCCGRLLRGATAQQPAPGLLRAACAHLQDPVRAAEEARQPQAEDVVRREAFHDLAVLHHAQLRQHADRLQVHAHGPHDLRGGARARRAREGWQGVGGRSGREAPHPSADLARRGRLAPPSRQAAERPTSEGPLALAAGAPAVAAWPACTCCLKLLMPRLLLLCGLQAASAAS
jgi:hypothetical protein